ncbi:AAA family ATPase [Streptomyces sp. NPDC001275]
MGVAASRVRRLILIAVSDYGDGNADFAKGIVDQVGVVTGWLADPELGADRVFETREPPQTLYSVQQVRQFLADEDLATAERDEAIVVYITGHGQRGASSGRHYLRFARTDDGRLPATALTTSEVITAALGSLVEHVLVLVDSCFAGALANEVPLLLRDLGARRKSASLAVVAASDFDEQPQVGSFTELLNRALERIDAEESGFAEPYLSFDEWQQVLDSVSGQDRGLVEAHWVWPPKRSREPSPCLPNPRYRPPQRLSTAVRELPDAVGLFVSYWRDRASGRTHEQDTGWYFSGRHRVMRTLIAFLGEGEGVMVVTGAAGSGKSALLARLVTLSDPLFLSQPDLARLVEAVPEEERPPIASVDAAVLARNKTALGLVEDLLRALGAGAVPAATTPLQALLEHLRARARHERVPTVVIDALDEAEQTLACLNDVVLPLARLRAADGRPLLRLVLGVRSSSPAGPDVLPRLSDLDADALLHLLVDGLEGDEHQRVPVRVQRTDEPDCEEDIATYVEALLTESVAGPYAGQTKHARAAARTVAHAVAPSFLDARLAADQLRTADQMQDLTALVWQRRLTQGTVALLREDLHAVAGHQGVPVDILVRVLRATAFGAGSGLPWAEVWPAVARALEAPASDLTGMETYAAAIRTVMTTRLTGYLAEGEEDGRTTYRPVHQQVADVLVKQPSWLVDAWVHDEQPLPYEEREQARITDALAALVPESFAHPPHPYIRRHLIAHAAAGGVLDDDHLPLQLLAQETSRTLRQQLELPLPLDPTPMNLLTLTAAALIEPYVTEDTDVASRHSSIALHRTALTREDQAGDAAPAAPLNPQWGWWESATNVLASSDDHVHALTAVEVSPGRVLLAAGTKAGAHIWDASSGQRLTDLPAGFVQSMCTVRGASGRSFLATAGPRGVAIWDPLSGLQIGRSPTTRATGVQVIADGDQRWKLFVRGQVPAIWRPDADQFDFLPGATDEETASLRGAHAVVYGEQRQPLLAAQSFGRLILRDLVSGGIRASLPFSKRGLRKMMGVRRPGRADLVLVVTSEHALIWDPDTGEQVDLGTGPAAYPVQVPDQGGRVAIAFEQKGHVQVWELHDATWHFAAAVSVGPISALAALPSVQGQWRVATAGESGLRLWYPTLVTSSTIHDMASRPVTALTTLQVRFDGGLVRDVWAIGTPSGVELADARADHWHHLLPTGTAHSLHALPQGLLAVHTDHGYQVWDPPRDARIQSAGAQHESSTTSRLTARNMARCLVDWPPGTPSVVTAYPGGVQLTDVLGGEEISVPIECAGQPRVVTAVPAPDATARWIALGTRGGVLIWDLAAEHVVTQLRMRGQQDTRALTLVRAGDTTLLAAASRGRIQTWDTATWKEQATTTAPWTKTLAAVPLSASRSLLASGSGHAVHLWDPSTAGLLHTLVTAAPIEAIAAMRDGGTTLIGIGGPAGFAALNVDISVLAPPQ